MYKVGFIGAGNMGSALAKATEKSGLAELYIYDKDVEKSNYLANSVNGKVISANEMAEICDYVFLAVKPNIIAEAVKNISKSLEKNTKCTLISMAAGVNIEKVKGALGSVQTSVIRIMPNTPVALGEGMVLCSFSENVSEEQAEGFKEILKYAGKLDMLPEKLIDQGSALSGCGPAFVYMFIEALADGAVGCGLPRDKALMYAAQTLKGSAEMILAGAGHPEELKDAVCSPGGSTIEGVRTLERGSFRASVSEAVISAYNKTLLLGK